MPFDYAEMLATADELLEYFGQPAVLTSPGTSSGDVFNPTPGAPATEVCTIVEIDYEQGEIDNSAVLATDKRILIKVGDLSATVVASARTIAYGGKTFTIVGPVKAINPGGTLLLYEAQARA